MSQTAKDIDFMHLHKEGIKACFFDIDHTILARDSGKIDSSVVESLINSKIDYYIATNRSLTDDVNNIAKQIEAKGIMCSDGRKIFKPRKVYYKKLIEMSGLKPNQIAMIGDRLVQDIWGSNRMGVTSVLVNKLGSQTFFDRILSIPDKIIPILFRFKYKDIKR